MRGSMRGRRRVGDVHHSKAELSAGGGSAVRESADMLVE